MKPYVVVSPVLVEVPSPYEAPAELPLYCTLGRIYAPRYLCAAAVILYNAVGIEALAKHPSSDAFVGALDLLAETLRSGALSLAALRMYAGAGSEALTSAVTAAVTPPHALPDDV